MFYDLHLEQSTVAKTELEFCTKCRWKHFGGCEGTNGWKSPV